MHLSICKYMHAADDWRARDFWPHMQQVQSKSRKHLLYVICTTAPRIAFKLLVWV